MPEFEPKTLKEKMAKFQVALAGDWKNYTDTEDAILKRAYMAGFPNCRFKLRGCSYEYSFDRMVQKNLTTGKERKIRAPHHWQQPAQPIVPKGPTLYMKVPAGSPGKTIEVDHPNSKGVKIQVAVPKHAKVGQDMLVPVQDVAVATNVSVVTAGVLSMPSECNNNVESTVQPKSSPKAAVLLAKAKTFMSSKHSNSPAASPGNDTNAKPGWSTRAKLAAGGAAAAALGGGAFLTAYAATEARDGSGGGGVPPADDGSIWCPTDVYDSYPIGTAWDGGASPADDGICGEAPPEDAGFAGCGGAGGEDGGAPDEIICAEDDAEWLADMCGVQDEFSGDGADAVADLVVDLF